VQGELVHRRPPAWNVAPLLVLLLAMAGACSQSPQDPDSSTTFDWGPAADQAAGACSPTDPRSAPVVVSVQPDEGEKAYVDLIGRARKSLRVFAYLMGAGGVLDGLKAQAQKGLDVRVILDAGQTANVKYEQQLVAAGAKVMWSDTTFPFMHAKVIVGDDREAIISTGNFSLSYIQKERNFTAVTSDPKDVGTLLALFEADWQRKSADLTCTRLLVAPTNSRPRLLDLIGAARTSLVVHSMQFADTEIRTAVHARHQAGVDVRVLLADPGWVETNTDGAAFLKGAGIPVRWLASPSVHTKDIVVDGKLAYLGSINLSNTSISKNREVGIIFNDASAVQRLLSAFEKDWAAATAF
jgi:phosphatidylserine/phosphatidylglycerophosphate/cardiolipin synthase-like enzyme